jgi:hypothetical protein
MHRDSISYNTHLHALSMHAKVPVMLTKANELLGKWKNALDVSDTGQRNMRRALVRTINLFDYNLVIVTAQITRTQRGYAGCFEVLRKLVKRDNVDPDTFSFNPLCAFPGQHQGRCYSYGGGITSLYGRYISVRSASQHLSHWGYTSVIVAHSQGRRTAEQAQELLNQIKAVQFECGKFEPNRVLQCLGVGPRAARYSWGTQGGILVGNADHARSGR